MPFRRRTTPFFGVVRVNVSVGGGVVAVVVDGGCDGSIVVSSMAVMVVMVGLMW